MANIFKRIKTIDEVGDLNAAPADLAKAAKSATALGLKPILKNKSDDIIRKVVDFDDDFPLSDISDLDIPFPENDAANGELANQSEVNDASDEAPNIAGALIPNFLSRKTTSASIADEITQIKPYNKRIHLHPVHETAPDTGSDTGLLKKTAKGSSEESQIIKPVDSTNMSTSDMGQVEMGQVEMGQVEMGQVEKLPRFITHDSNDLHANMPEFKTPRWPYLVLAGLAFLWLISSAAAGYGYFELGLTALTAQPIHALGFAGFVLVPACLLFLTALLLRRMNSLSRESQALAFLNQKLLSPPDHVQGTAVRLADEITRQMDRIEQRADQAFNRLTQVQSGFEKHIIDVGDRLTASAAQQVNLDTQLQTSKSAWTNSVRETDQTISDLSETLDRVIESFQSRIDTAHNQMAGLGEKLHAQMITIGDALTTQSQETDDILAPLLGQAEQIQLVLAGHSETTAKLKAELTQGLGDVDNLIAAQTDKLNALNAQQDAIKSGRMALNDRLHQDHDAMQDQLSAQMSQLKAMAEKTEALLKTVDHVANKAAHMTPRSIEPTFISPAQAVVHQPDLALRGTIKDEQLNLLPGLGAAKDMLPGLLTPDDGSDPLTLSFEDIDPKIVHDVMQPSSPPREPQTLSSQRVFGREDPVHKPAWFKRFGRRSSDASLPAGPIDAAAAPLNPAALNHGIGPISAPPETLPPQASLHQRGETSLRVKLITRQLSPDALINSGCVRQAARLRLQDGSFVMSRYVATQLGAAADYLKGLLPEDTALRQQVYDIAAAFPMREQLDRLDEAGLIRVFESEAGREYLLCDAALNG